jgi:hypothetical protein
VFWECRGNSILSYVLNYEEVFAFYRCVNELKCITAKSRLRSASVCFRIIGIKLQSKKPGGKITIKISEVKTQLSFIFFISSFEEQVVCAGRRRSCSLLVCGLVARLRWSSHLVAAISWKRSFFFLHCTALHCTALTTLRKPQGWHTDVFRALASSWLRPPNAKQTSSDGARRRVKSRAWPVDLMVRYNVTFIRVVADSTVRGCLLCGV